MSTRPALARDATAARELAAALTEAASEMSNAAEPNQATDAVMLPTDRAQTANFTAPKPTAHSLTNTRIHARVGELLGAPSRPSSADRPTLWSALPLSSVFLMGATWTPPATASTALNAASA
jgi:hypothetical protein